MEHSWNTFDEEAQSAGVKFTAMSANLPTHKSKGETIDSAQCEQIY